MGCNLWNICARRKYRASRLFLVAILPFMVNHDVLAAQALRGGVGDGKSKRIYVENSDELTRALRAARPGARILLRPGTYRGGLTLDNLQGTAEKPIEIAGADTKNPPIIEGGSNCFHFVNPAHLKLTNVVLTGARQNGINIDDGGSYETPAHHVVLRNVTVRKIGSDGNHDGIKLSGLDDFMIENCTVERWGRKGSGIDMAGCHRGVIQGSTFRDGDDTLGNAVQTKGGSSEITIRRCRFEDAGGRAINIGGSTGAPYFRPKNAGYEAKNILVEDCTFIGSMAPIAFVGVDGAVVRYNVIYRPTRWVLRILQENRANGLVPCRGGKFVNNIIVYRSKDLSRTVNLGDKTEPKSFEFAENVWYLEDRPERSRASVRLPTPERNGVYGIDPGFVDPARGNLQLKKSSPVRGAGPRSHR